MWIYKVNRNLKGLMYNWITQSSLTIKQFIDEHKVVFDVLLTDLAKVGRHNITHFVEELKHHGSIDILLGDSCQPDVGTFDMEKAGPGNVGHRGSNLLPGVNHVHAEGVHSITPGMQERVRQRNRRMWTES